MCYCDKCLCFHCVHFDNDCVDDLKTMCWGCYDGDYLVEKCDKFEKEVDIFTKK